MFSNSRGYSFKIFVDNQLKRSGWKGPCHNLSHNSSNCLEGLWKTRETLDQDTSIAAGIRPEYLIVTIKLRYGPFCSMELMRCVVLHAELEFLFLEGI
jgi:hypothetical protein